MQAKSLAVFAMMLCISLAGSQSHAMAETFNAYAPPGVWGNQTATMGHLGARTYRLSFDSVGSTLVVGEVEYVDEQKKTVRKEFRGEIVFSVGDVVASPKVRFKGIPTGSAVRVNVK